MWIEIIITCALVLVSWVVLVKLARNLKTQKKMDHLMYLFERAYGFEVSPQQMADIIRKGKIPDET